MQEEYMREALKEAEKAKALEEIPVGAVIVHKGRVIGRGYNLKENLKNPLKHAEIIAIHQAAEFLGGWRLVDCEMYVTLEPCAMCSGAIVQARIDKLYIGTEDYKTGACGSTLNIVNYSGYNHQVDVTFGLLQAECQEILKSFFKALRAKKKLEKAEGLD